MKATASALALVVLALAACAALPFPCLDPSEPGVSVLPDGRCATTFLGLEVAGACCAPAPPSIP